MAVGFRSPMQIEFQRFFVSPVHSFFGRRGLSAGGHPVSEVTSVRCRQGQGIEGDRFYGYRPDYQGQITFFSAEVLAELRAAFAAPALSAGVLRRNVLIAGTDPGALIGRRFSIAGVIFEGTGEARPCHWMDHAVAPGAEVWLRGRGGLRARILSDGLLSLGPATLELSEEVLQPRHSARFVGKRAVELRLEGGI
jgi:MOSC domain-containing protein YiiM